MTLKQTLRDYLMNKTIRREEPDEGYWIGYVRKGLWTDACLTDTQQYDGKYRVYRTYDQINELVPKLIELLRRKKISCFKHKNKETPIDPRYADKLPPIFIFLKKKQTPKVDAELDALGLEDRVWINDTRNLIDFEAENVKRARELGMFYNGRNFVEVR